MYVSTSNNNKYQKRQSDSLLGKAYIVLTKQIINILIGKKDFLIY